MSVLAFTGCRPAPRVATLIAASGLTDAQIARRLNMQLIVPFVRPGLVALWRVGHSEPSRPLLELLEDIGAGPSRFELVELADGCTVVDLEGERLADPHAPWSRPDAEAVLAVLARRPGYATQIP